MLIKICFLVVLILEILFIIKAKRTKDKKYFKVSSGLFWGFFISMFIYSIYFSLDIYSYNTGEWISLQELIISFFLSALNLIIGVVCLIFRMSAKKKGNFIDTSKKGVTVKYILLVSIIIFTITFCNITLKYHEKNVADNNIRLKAMTYLQKKYGTNNFKILEIDREFAHSGIFETDDLENYDITAIYFPDNITFSIALEPWENGRSSDTLMSAYFNKYFTNDDFKNDGNNAKEKLSEFLATKGLNVEVLLDNYFYDLTAREVLSNDYGEIPTKIDLYNIILDYHLKHEFEIKINDYEIKSYDIKSELRLYLIKLSNYLIDYYNELDDFEIYCTYDGRKYFGGTIKINEEFINIDVGSIEEIIMR